MEAIILVGGLGTRLAARVQGLPKAMAPVGARPFLEILLRQLERSGVTRVVLSVGYLRAAIEEHFGAEFAGLRLDYAVEETPLGTGGAIRNALALAQEDAVLVLNGDTFLDADFAAMMRFHRDEGAAMTMAVKRQADIARYGGVVMRGKRIVGFEEKGRSGPGWINAGAYVIEKGLQWPLALPEKFSFESDVLERDIARIVSAAYRVNGVFLDIGVPEDFDRAQIELAAF